ncbi:MAG: hypothetical protein Q7O66_17915 [Dehalococcoidia bacterium]|nr:hypothetical protein [Dehalococcoidia bacterium]
MIEESVANVQAPPVLKHSGFGIASFMVAVAVGATELLSFSASLFLQTATPGGLRRTSPIAASLGFLMCSGIVMNLVGIVMAAVGSIIKGRKKTFSTLGLVLNITIILAMIGLFIAALFVAYDVDLHAGNA